MEYDNTNRGALFRNNNKQTDKHPDLQGKIDVNGVEYVLYGWKKESKNGVQFISLSVQKAGEYRKDSGSAQYTDPEVSRGVATSQDTPSTEDIF